MPYVNNKSTDHPAHPHRLINAFLVRCLDSIIPISIIPILAKYKISRLCGCTGRFVSYLVADPKDGFSRDVPHTIPGGGVADFKASV